MAAAIAASPARDAEKNLKAMLRGALGRLDLVTREEFDIQARVLLRTREKLDALEARVAELEEKSRRRAAMSFAVLPLVTVAGPRSRPDFQLRLQPHGISAELPSASTIRAARCRDTPPIGLTVESAWLPAA